MEWHGTDLPLAEYIMDLRDQHKRGQITRQDFLRWGALFGASLPLLTRMAGPAESARAAGRAAATATPQKGGILRCSSFMPAMTTMEPPLIQDVSSAATVQAVCEQLVRVGADMIARPHLAESWTASADAKTWTFKIRKGITFNNGQPFSADDVVWTFQMLVDPKTASSARSTLDYLKTTGIEKVDAYTVRFHLDRPVAVFPYDINNYMIVMLPKNWPGNFAKNPIGTGPYLLKELIVGDHATFTRNPNYWRKPLPYLDGLRITYAKTDLAEVNMLLSGQTDVQLFAFSPLVLKRYPTKVKLLLAHSSAYTPFHMRSDMKPFNDNRVREAFKYVVDRQQLVKVAYHNYADLGNDHMVAPVYPEYTNNGLRKQDYAKAKALLAAAGYPNGLQIDFFGVGSSGSVAPEALAFQQMAAPAGIKVTLRPEPTVQYYNHWTTVPFGMVGWVGRPTVDAMLNLAFRCNVPWNESHWCEPTFDRWLDQLDATVELEKRKAIARKIEDYMTHQGPEIIWGFQDIFRATRLNVHGLDASPISHADLDAVWIAKS